MGVHCPEAEVLFGYSIRTVGWVSIVCKHMDRLGVRYVSTQTPLIFQDSGTKEASNVHQTLPTFDRLAGFGEKPAEKPTDRCSVSGPFFPRFSPIFPVFFVTDRDRSTLSVKKINTDRAIFRFGSQSCTSIADVKSARVQLNENSL